MRKIFILWLIIMVLAGCQSKADILPTTSLRFTPLNFPHSNLGEFTLHENTNSDQLQLFLSVVQNTLAHGQIDDSIALQDMAHTFSLQLFSNHQLTAIYRLSFDFEKDIAFLQNQNHIYAVAKSDFHQIIETGYFNVIFQKNHAPTATFLLNNKDIKYSVNGTWNYETYQNNFLSYQIKKEQDQSTNYIVTDNTFSLTYSFPEKQPDQVFEAIYSPETGPGGKHLLSSDQLHIPANEGTYLYEIEAIWSNPNLPYKAALTYQFRLEVNYPPKIKLDSQAYAGELVTISIENYDTKGRIQVESDLWDEDISLTLINQKFYGLLPIPLNTEPGQYDLKIIGTSSPENLLQKESLQVKSKPSKQVNVSKSQLDKLGLADNPRDFYQLVYDYNINQSPEEKLWSGPFHSPSTGKIFSDYGDIIKSKDQKYQYPYIIYMGQTGDVTATANGLVRSIIQTDQGYHILIDHGLGLLSIYSGLSALTIGTDSYIYAKQVIGQVGGPDSSLIYTNLVHGYFVNPGIFFDQDPISLYK